MNTQVEIPLSSQDKFKNLQPVQTDLLVLAAGVWPSSGKARLTLQVEPKPDGEVVENPGDAMTLQNWPSSVVTHVGNEISLTFLQISKEDANKAPRPENATGGRSVFPARLRGLAEADDTTLQRATSLWQKMLADAPDLPDQSTRGRPATIKGGWPDLTLSLRLSQDNKGVSGGSALGSPTGAVPDLQDKQYGADGQIMSKRLRNEASISGITAVPHGDLALALEQQRTEELCISLFEACGDRGKRANQEAERRKELNSDPMFDELRKILEAKSAPEAGALKAVLGEDMDISALWAADQSDEAKKNALDLIRKCLKKLERKALSTALEASRKVNSQAYCQEQKRLQSGSCDEEDQPVCRSLDDSGVYDKARREEAMKLGCMAHQYASWPQYTAKDDSPLREGNPQSVETAIVQRFAALKSDPVLARLTGLTIDVELDAQYFEQLEDGFYLVAARVGSGADSIGVNPGDGATWTLLEIDDQGSEVKFWPATERAVRLGLGSPLKGSVPRQSHGLIALSQGACGSASGVPRFDLTSVELRAATEAEMQRRMARQSNVDVKNLPQQDDDPDTIIPEADDLSLGAKYLTGGLTLLMRSVGTDAAISLARRDERLNSTDVVLDAEDLTTGVRPIVGIPQKPSNEVNTEATLWSPLMARSIEYGTSGTQRSEVRRLISTVFADEEMSNLRKELEAGFLTTPSRLLPTGDDSQEAMIDEAFTSWDGSPMGVDVTSLSNNICDVHAFGRRLTLPRKGMETLRFGVPYRFAVAAVYSGGVSRQVESLPSIARADERPAFYPAPVPGAEGKDVAPFFRFLRHEKIAAPEIALPLGHALRSNGQRRNTGNGRGLYPLPHVFAGPMGFDTGPRMVVRSLGPYREENGNGYDERMVARATPEICHRVVLVPNVPFDCAEWHGAFDKTQKARPDGNFTWFAGSRARVTNPVDRENLIVTRTNLQRGVDNRSFLDARTYTDFPNDALSSDTVTLGDAVIKRNRRLLGDELANLSRERKLTRYYADPMAERIAFGIRLAGESEYLEGGPIIYDVSDVPVRLNDRLVTYSRIPVVVTTLVEDGPSRPSPTHVDDIVTVGSDARYRWFDADSVGDGFEGRNREFAMLELRLALRPGEAVEIDVWSLPKDETLAREHALLQALGARLMFEGRSEGKSISDAILAGAKKCLPSTFSKRLEEEMDALKTTSMNARSYIISGGGVSPSNGSLKALGAAVTKTLECAPMPELVSSTTLSAVHATNRVAERPEALLPAVPQDPDQSQIAAVTGAAAEPRPVRAARPADLNVGTTEPLIVSAPGSTEFVLDGSVPFRTNEHDIVEIEAHVTLPGTSVFDDSNRGRSLARRRDGSWPTLRNLDGLVRLNEDASPVFRKAEDLFGFEVGRDGGVSFDRAKVTLLRAEGLPRTLPNGLLDLRDLFFGQIPGVRIAHRHVFPDGKARRMQVRVNALSRTLEDMRTASRVAHSNDPWTGRGEGRVYGLGEHVPAEYVPAQHQANRSEEREIILPATIRPAKPDAKTPVPLLEEEEGASKPSKNQWLWHTRRSSVRVPLGREWFSSGEDEGVGVVLWPPVFLEPEKKTEIDPKQSPKVTITDGYEPEKHRVVNLENILGKGLMFSDDDLGPGGKFVSRRGSDPVRGGVEREPVLSSFAIADLMRDQNDIRRAHFVENAIMPLDDEGKDGGNAETTKVPPMRVSLAVYEPRFDVERQEWYVDITLDAPMAPDGFVRLGLVRYQPHTVPELRCSRPVVQWVQPLSERKLRARQETPGRIFVEIEGAASGERALPDSVTGDNAIRKGVDLAALYKQAAMRFTLFRQNQNDGQTRRVVIKRRTDVISNGDEDETENGQAPSLLADAVLVTPERTTGSSAKWRYTLDISQYEDRPEDGTLGLLVEEIEHFRPASYAEEPVAAAMDAAWRSEFQEAGPRYSVFINLEDFNWNAS